MLDLSLLKQFSAESLSSLLRQLAGEKDLILEGRVMRCLNRIAGMELLKSCGVKRVFKMEGYKVDHSATLCRVFILQSSLDQARTVVDMLRPCPAGSVVLVFVPKLLQSIMGMLEEEGLVDKVLVREYCWQLIPVDAELLSLELPHFFSQCIVDGNLSQLGSVSKSLMDMQGLFGTIGHRVAFGKKSCGILSQLSLLESKCSSSFSSSVAPSSDLDHLLIVDRDSDLTTCLLSPVTYEALLDEVFGITMGQIDFENCATTPQSETLRNEKLELSSRDKIFEQIRHKHFSSIFSLLSSHARQLRQAQAKASSMNVNEMKEFVQNNLREMKLQSKAVSVHVGASETIQAEKGHIYEEVLALEQELVRGSGQKRAMAYLEQAAAQMVPEEVAFRLFCLITRCSSSGLSSSEHARVKKLLCDSYGHRHASTFLRLERAGLMVAPGGGGGGGGGDGVDQKLIKTKLGLVPAQPASQSSDRADLVRDRDPSFVFDRAFCPAVCRLAKLMVESPEALAELARATPALNIVAQQVRQGARASSSSSRGALLIFFVGGFTLAEVTALRALQSTVSVPFVVAGTSKESGGSIMAQMLR